MIVKACAAAILAAATLLAPVAAPAADLDERDGPRRYNESPYDDPRYRDLYADDPRQRAPRYDTYREPPPGAYPPGSYKDEPYRTPPPRYSEGPRYDERGCLSRRDVHERLTSGGWHGFHDIEMRGRVAYVKARRPSGRVFDLEVDRCTGGIISARPLGPVARPYAWDPPGYYERR